MRYLILFVVLFSRPNHADNLDLSRHDQQLHATMSYAITQTSYMIAKKHKVKYALIKAAIFTSLLGVAKECSDKTFSTGDLKADSVGILGSGIVILTFQLP